MWVEICLWLCHLLFLLPHPHGCVSWNTDFINVRIDYRATPSRVCELKFGNVRSLDSAESHTLTGVWVEIFLINFRFLYWQCHTLTGVWVEMTVKSFNILFLWSHTLTGVWVEIIKLRFIKLYLSHTLTGVWVEIGGTKTTDAVGMSHPHGCVSWNSQHISQGNKLI